eukprot:TRINITY_DN4509_c0_g1_i5.p1 TRINITY_DN4509_c0_g1~~TRINITY_DN4509_c0_g1_i5.p1  ORF type:complete len:221 (+),score=-7.19 TRINITY_DN4509_c0_g1_i5:316-978(+)
MHQKFSTIGQNQDNKEISHKYQQSYFHLFLRLDFLARGPQHKAPINNEPIHNKLITKKILVLGFEQKISSYSITTKVEAIANTYQMQSIPNNLFKLIIEKRYSQQKTTARMETSMLSYQILWKIYFYFMWVIKKIVLATQIFQIQTQTAVCINVISIRIHQIKSLMRLQGYSYKLCRRPGDSKYLLPRHKNLQNYKISMKESKNKQPKNKQINFQFLVLI